MSSAKRRNRIVEILKYETEAITAQELADLLSVSKRTIHSDLELLSSEGFEIVKIPGTGITLESTSQQQSTRVDVSTTFYRRTSILKKLLFLEETVNHIALSEEFYVSNSSIQSDMQYIKEEFLNSDLLEFVSDEQGTRLIGNEEQWQRTLIHFNEIVQQYYDLQYYDQNTIQFLVELYGEEIGTICYEIVNSFPKFNLISVAQYYSLNIVNLLVVLAFRSKKGYHHSKKIKSSYIADEVMMLQHYLIAKDILDLVTVQSGIEFSDDDAQYLSSYLYGNRIHFAASSVKLGEGYEGLIDGFIKQMSECTKVDLSADTQLRNQLMLHVVPMIYRLKNGIHIKNPLLEEIKSEFRLMFDLTWLVSDSLRSELQVNITEDEIAFLMLYYQTALERAKKSKRIVVVCPNGVTTSALIASKIKRLLPPLDIIEIASLSELERFTLANVDFIVSTIPLKDIEVPTIVISPLLSENDIRKIERLYKDNLEKAATKRLYSNAPFLKYVSEDYIFANQTATTKDEVIETVCRKLVSDGIVSKGYEKSLKEREEKGGTDIASGGAIPHGSLDEVYETKVVVWTNRKAFKWTKYQVRVIIFFVIKKEDVKEIREILEDIFHLIETKDDVELIASYKSEEGLYKYLIGG